MPKVIKKFRDKHTKVIYPVGSEYEGSDSRISELHDKGYLDEKSEQPKETKPLKPKHVGGGWYKLPNGKKVKGKNKALKVLESGE